MTNKENDFPKV